MGQAGHVREGLVVTKGHREHGPCLEGCGIPVQWFLLWGLQADYTVLASGKLGLQTDYMFIWGWIWGADGNNRGPGLSMSPLGATPETPFCQGT